MYEDLVLEVRTQALNFPLSSALRRGVDEAGKRKDRVYLDPQL